MRDGIMPAGFDDFVMCFLRSAVEANFLWPGILSPAGAG